MIALGLWFPAAPVLASSNPVQQLPVALPSMPQAIPELTAEQLPSFSLPNVNNYSFPSAEAQISAARSKLGALFNESRVALNQEFENVSAEMGRTRLFINRTRQIVGAPLAVNVQSDTTRVTTAYAVAVQMTGAMQTSVAYLRGLSSLGATGLNLTFIFLGLGWLMFLKLLEIVIALAVALRTFMLGVIRWILEFLGILFDVLQLARVLAFFL